MDVGVAEPARAQRVEHEARDEPEEQDPLRRRDHERAPGRAEAHEVAAFAMAGLVILHVAGALKHQFIDRDGLMARMK